MAPCCVFYARRRRHHIYWRFDTNDKGFCRHCDLISHINKRTQHTGPTDWYTHKCILTSTVMYIQQLTALHWITCRYKNLLSSKQCPYFSNITHLSKLYLLIRFKSFQWNTKKWYRSANKKTHTTHRETDNFRNG